MDADRSNLGPGGRTVESRGGATKLLQIPLCASGLARHQRLDALAGLPRFCSRNGRRRGVRSRHVRVRAATTHSESPAGRTALRVLCRPRPMH